jgi:hypothetical protein
MRQTPGLLINSREISLHRLKTLSSLLHRLHTALRYSRLHHHPSPWPQKTLYKHSRYRTEQAPTLTSWIKGVTDISCVCKLRSVIVINHSNAQPNTSPLGPHRSFLQPFSLRSHLPLHAPIIRRISLIPLIRTTQHHSISQFHSYTASTHLLIRPVRLSTRLIPSDGNLHLMATLLQIHLGARFVDSRVVRVVAAVWPVGRVRGVFAVVGHLEG